MEVMVEIPKLNRIVRLEVSSTHSLDSVREVICRDLNLGGKGGWSLIWHGVEVDNYSRTIGELDVREGDKFVLIQKAAAPRPRVAAHPGEAERVPRRKYLRYLALGTATAVAAGAYIYQAAKHVPAQRPSTAKTATPISTPPTPTPIQGKGPLTLVFSSPEWLPGSLTGEIAKGFTEWSQKRLGYPVTVKMDLNPWGTYHDRLATVFAAKGSDFDLLAADTQFIGEFATNGHILRLNDWIRDHQGRDISMFDFPSNLVKYYCTYPVSDFDEEKFQAGDLQLDTVNYWGLPYRADTMLLVWRADLFRHPDERAAFKAKYGYDLPQTYDDWLNWVTWLHFKDFAEFFTRKAGEKLAGQVLAEDFYGCATWNSTWDSCIHQFHSYLREMGGDIWEEKSHKVKGCINSEVALEALKWYSSLRPYEPPGSEAYWFDETITAMIKGRVAIAVNAAVFLPPLFDPKVSVVHDKIEVTAWPGMVRDHGPYADGEYHRITPLVGESICVNAYSKREDEALAFLSYWFSEESQWRWSDGGGGTASMRILNTDRFVNATPWSRAHRDTVGTQKDFWNVPVYNELMSIEGEIINAVYAGKTGNLKEALDELAYELERILEDAGLL